MNETPRSAILSAAAARLRAIRFDARLRAPQLMQKPRTLVVTPTYNEKDNLHRFVDAVRGALPEADLLIVDDNSPDGTGQLADEIAAKDPKVRVMHRAGKQGLGTAYIQAFNILRGLTAFLEMDADLSHDVRYLPDFSNT